MGFFTFLYPTIYPHCPLVFALKVHPRYDNNYYTLDGHFLLLYFNKVLTNRLGTRWRLFKTDVPVVFQCD